MTGNNASKIPHAALQVEMATSPANVRKRGRWSGVASAQGNVACGCAELDTTKQSLPGTLPENDDGRNGAIDTTGSAGEWTERDRDAELVVGTCVSIIGGAGREPWKIARSACE